MSKKSNIDDEASFAGSQIAASQAVNYANATDAMVEGMDKMLDEWTRLGNNPQKHGNLFEFIERARFNTNAALQDTQYKLELTSAPTSQDIPKDVHAKADGLITDNGKITKSIQYKAEELSRPEIG